MEKNTVEYLISYIKSSIESKETAVNILKSLDWSTDTLDGTMATMAYDIYNKTRIPKDELKSTYLTLKRRSGILYRRLRGTIYATAIIPNIVKILKDCNLDGIYLYPTVLKDWQIKEIFDRLIDLGCVILWSAGKFVISI